MKINEIFQSINGEVTAWHQGSLTTFIRFSGCNLNCSYCDAAYAKEANYNLSIEEIIQILEKTGCKQVTLTGGEPTLQWIDGVYDLVRNKLLNHGYKITIETNGTFEILPLSVINNLSWVIDYKFNYPKQMMISNFQYMGKNDWLKFVIDHPDDLNQMVRVFHLFPDLKLLNIAVGTTDRVPHAEIVDFLIANKLYNCVLNYQIHKEIWKDKKEGNKIL